MKITFIENNGNGVDWYDIDGRIVGLTDAGKLIDEDGAIFDCVDPESVAERTAILDALEEFNG